MAAQAGAAGGGGHGAAGLDEGLDQALGHGVQGDLLGGGDDDAAHPVVNLAALEHRRGLTEVVQPAVGAGADDHLVNVGARHLIHGAGVGGQVGQGHGGLEGIQVDDHLLLILGVGVGLHRLPGPGHPAVQIGPGLVVHGEDAVLGARLDGHIGDGEAVVHRQGVHPFPAKLQGLVQGAVHPDGTDEVEDHILTGDTGLELAFQSHLDGGGNAEPGQAGGHAGGHVGGAHAGGEHAHRAVGAGVGVGADHTLAGGGEALLGQQGVLHPHAAHVVEVGDVEPLGKLPHLGAELGGLDILAGGVVIQHQGDPVLVEYLGQPGLIEFRNRHRGGDVVAQHQIQLGLHQLAGDNVVQAGMLGQDLLGHGHSHLWVPPLYDCCIQHTMALVKRM